MYLLDTNVVSELRRPRPAARVVEFISRRPLPQLYLSTVTFAELRFGIELVSEGAKRADLLDWLTQKVRPMFAGRVFDLDENVLLRWRRLMQNGRTIGHTYPQPDLLIAVTALEHGLTLVTRDTEDFRRTGVVLVDPWG